MKLRARNSGMTLTETLVGMGITVFILAVLTAGSISLQTSYAGASAYAAAEGDQMRISDYIALDVRRAISAAAAVNAAITTTINGVSTSVTVPNLLTLTRPDFYDGSGNPNEPAFTANGAITYGATPVMVRYFQIGTSFYRETTGVATAIAKNVGSFEVTEQDLTANVKCTIKFVPKFARNGSDAAKNGTTLVSSTFLRNAVARQ